jgi:hypothetical protein
MMPTLIAPPFQLQLRMTMIGSGFDCARSNPFRGT